MVTDGSHVRDCRSDWGYHLQKRVPLYHKSCGITDVANMDHHVHILICRKSL